MIRIIRKLAVISLLASFSPLQAASWVTYPPAGTPNGKRIVFISGDEEYRSEEALPMLAKILAVHHGFHCTVLFSLNPTTGNIDPNNQTNTPGLAAIQQADLVFLFTRFREWPDSTMRYFADHYVAGKPFIGIRTATHAFNYTRNTASPYARYDFASTVWPGGFGKQVLGETWVNHWGIHGSQSTRGIIRAASASHVILKGVANIWGPTDVYQVGTLPADATVLVDGQVLTGMNSTDPALAGKATMPIVWTRQISATRIVTSTIGAATDMANAGLRRLLVNACYWAVGMENSIPALSVVDYVGTYNPTNFGLNLFTTGVKPDDLALPVPLLKSRFHSLGQDFKTLERGWKLNFYRFDGRRIRSLPLYIP